MGVAIERVRFQVRQGMRQALGDGRYAAVLIALAMGGQAGVSREDWKVLNRSSITHLVSISGMHVTLMAALWASGLGAVWRRVRWRGVDLAQRCPAQVVAAIVGFWIALLYCLLAGWGIPARRTFFMLAVVVAAALSRLPLSPSRILLCAAALVCLLDPRAVLAPGFWLSFGAVAILLRASSTSMKPRFTPRSWGARLRQGLHSFTHLQMAITVGLTPLLAFWV
jgi:competence protein ComEC